MGSTPAKPKIQDNPRRVKIKNKIQKIKIPLKIQFLNYGAATSPFQYKLYENDIEKDRQQQELQDIFQQQYKLQLGRQFSFKEDWNIGDLDKHTRKGRYSPLYYDDIGIQNNKFFMDFQAFTKKWNEAFQIIINNMRNNFPEKLPKQDEVLKKQTDNLLVMDWVFFRAFVVYAYRNQNKTFQEIIDKEKVSKYQQFMNLKFYAKILDEKQKVIKLLRHLSASKVDIFFLQEIDQNILRFIQKKTSNFRIAQCKHAKSAILISLQAIEKITGNQIKPLEYYNRQYINPQMKFQQPRKNSYRLASNKNDEKYFQKKIDHHFKFLQVPKIPKIQNKEKQSLDKKVQQSPQKSQNQKQENMTSSSFNLKQTMSSLQDNKKKYISQKLFKDLEWNQSTIVQFINQIILITSYLNMTKSNQKANFKDTSQQAKKQSPEKMVKHTSQLGKKQSPKKYVKKHTIIDTIKDSLEQLKKQFPKHTIIVGLNVDQDLDDIDRYYIFPQVHPRKVPTVSKQKTLIQPSISKANIPHFKTVDYFITSLPMDQAHVIDINNNINALVPKLIPNEDHPFDHYILSGSISYQKKKKKVQMIEAEEEEEH